MGLDKNTPPIASADLGQVQMLSTDFEKALGCVSRGAADAAAAAEEIAEAATDGRRAVLEQAATGKFNLLPRNIWKAARRGDLMAVTTWVASVDPRDINTPSLTGLRRPCFSFLVHAAAGGGPEALDVLRFLIAHPHFQVDREDDDGMSPLDVAVHCGNTGAITLLLGAGAKQTEHWWNYAYDKKMPLTMSALMHDEYGASRVVTALKVLSVLLVGLTGVGRRGSWPAWDLLGPLLLHGFIAWCCTAWLSWTVTGMSALTLAAYPLLLHGQIDKNRCFFGCALFARSLWLLLEGPPPELCWARACDAPEPEALDRLWRWLGQLLWLFHPILTMLYGGIVSATIADGVMIAAAVVAGAPLRQYLSRVKVAASVGSSKATTGS